MATTPSLTRAQLASVFPDDRVRLAFEALLRQVAGLPPDLANVNFVVTAADVSAPNAHVLTAGTGISVVGGTGTVTIGLTGAVVTGFSAGTTGLTPSSLTTGGVVLSGTLATTNGGTGQTAYTDGQVLIGNTATGSLSKATLTAGSGITITNAGGAITISASAVGAQTANTIFAGPTTGAAAAPTFRAMVTADIPNSIVTEAKLSLANNTTANVSTSAHGFAPILPNDATKYLDGTGAYSVPAGGGGTGRLIGTRVITSGSGTYTPTTGTNSVVITIVGGGGGGGGCAAAGAAQASLANGGQGGGTLQVRLTSAFSGASYAVGAGGSGGTAGANAGTDGGDTTFTTTTPTTYTAKGGKNQGAGTGPFGMPWGKGASGTFNLTTGGDWAVSGAVPPPTLALAHFNVFTGQGGSSLYSLGATVGGAGGTTPSAGGYGGGGGGAASDAGVAVAGGAGSAGIIIIYEYS